MFARNLGLDEAMLDMIGLKTEQLCLVDDQPATDYMMYYEKYVEHYNQAPNFNALYAAQGKMARGDAVEHVK